MKQKKAFSLIEVLMVMGIIAVVTAMGFSISKNSIENAYKLYWYTGFSALSDATLDSIMKGKFDPESPNLCNYSQHVGETLMKSANYTCSNTASFTAPNKISYLIEPVTAKNYYKITMTIPTPNMKKTFPNQTILIFNYDKGMLYPANISNSSTQISLHNRPDILPFYIKEDLSGGNVVKDFYGFNTAYCLVDNQITNLDALANISCSSAPTQTGIVVPISPR